MLKPQKNTNNVMAKAINPGIVRGHRQVARARIKDRVDQQFGNAAEAKPTRGDGHAIEQHTFKRRLGGRVDFIHGRPPCLSS